MKGPIIAEIISRTFVPLCFLTITTKYIRMVFHPLFDPFSGSAEDMHIIVCNMISDCYTDDLSYIEAIPSCIIKSSLGTKGIRTFQ